MLFALGLVPHAAAAPLTADEMHERYWTLTDVRDHVIEGDLAKAREDATALQQLPTKKRVRRKWRTYVAAVDAAANTVQNAESLDVAAAAVGQAAAACGECHAATLGGPRLTGAGNVPPQEWAPGQQMALHRWAMDWMWLGLLDHNDDAWKLGATELDNKTDLFQFADGIGSTDAHSDLEERVYDLAQYATTTDADRRGEVFGILVGTCSACHTMLKAAPEPDEPEKTAASDEAQDE